MMRLLILLQQITVILIQLFDIMRLIHHIAHTLGFEEQLQGDCTDQEAGRRRAEAQRRRGA